MKSFISLFLTFSLIGVSIEARGKMCLALDRQIIKVENLVKRDQAILNKSGRYLVYPEKRGKDSENATPAIMFLDLETQEKREFLYDDGSVVKANTDIQAEADTDIQAEADTDIQAEADTDIQAEADTDIQAEADTDIQAEAEENEWKYIYKFSKDESALFGFIKGSGTIKVWSLPDLEEKIISVTEGKGALQVGFLEDGRLMIVEMEKEKVELVLSIISEVASIIYGQKKETANPHIFEYYNEAYSLDYFFRVVDLSTLNQSERAFQNYLSTASCAIVDTALNRFHRVHEDGSLTTTSLTEKKEPVEIFGPVEGFTLDSHPIEVAKQCIFLSENLNVLQSPKKDGYIFRDLKEGKESFLAPEFLVFQLQEEFVKYEPPSLSLLGALIKYPFALSPDSSRVYHIPSGQYTSLRAKNLRLSEDGRISLEAQIKNNEAVLQVVSHPLNPYQREVVFEMDIKKVCNTNIGKDGLVTVMSFEGDLFFIDVESAVVHKRLGFSGQCFLKQDISAGSGTVFLGVNREGEHVVNKLHEQCVEESKSTVSDAIAENLIQLSQEENPSQSSHFISTY